MSFDLSHGLHHVNINVYATFHHNIPLSSRDRAIFTFSEFGTRQSFDRWKMSFLSLLGLILLISMFTQKFIKIFHSVQEIGLFSLFQNLNLGNASASPKWHLTIPWANLVNINAYAKFYQNIPNGLRVIDIFHEQAGDKIFINSPRTKSSQTVRWQNQMFHYRALYEIQFQVSVDFLRVVQS